MISFFHKKDRNEQAQTWAEAELSATERAAIEDAFQPLGSISAYSLLCSENPNTISALLGHLKKEPIRHLGYKIVPRIEHLAEQSVSSIDVHFAYSQIGAFLYRWRDLDEGALERAIFAFEKQIAVGKEAAEFFRKDKSWGDVPSHAGYRQLRIIEEKRGNYARALELCSQAKNEGWADDWDKQIARLNKKAENE